MDSEIIIVGAGISGLSAAKLLDEARVSVIVLEACNRVGGRTLTKRSSKTGFVDLGGSYIGPTQDRILRLSKELGIENYKVDSPVDDRDNQYYKNWGRTWEKSESVISLENPFVEMDINNIRWLMDKMGEEIPVDAPWNAVHAYEWDTMTYQQFLLKNCWTQGAIDFFNDLIPCVMSSNAYETSLLSFLLYIKQSGGTKRISLIENGAQERKFSGGAQLISERIAEKLGDEIVIKNSPVVGINQESKDYVLVKTLNGAEYKTKYVILACPPVIHMKIHFTPSLPALRNQLNQRMPMGTALKAIIYYRTKFWSVEGLVGTPMVRSTDDHPIFDYLDDTKPDGKQPAIVVFVTADKCQKIVNLLPSDRKRIIAQSLVDITGSLEALEPIHYEEKLWMEEQYIGGCFTAVNPPGFLTRYGRALRTPIDRLYFAGTETAIKWSGYMDGAVEAGERASREVLYTMGKISQDQIWLEEPVSEDVIPKQFDDCFREKYTPSVSGFLKIVITLSTLLAAATSVYMK